MGNNRKGQASAQDERFSSRLHPEVIRKIRGNYKAKSQFKCLFGMSARDYSCLFRQARDLLNVRKINPFHIRDYLAFQCRSIEHQIIALRRETQLTLKEYRQRYEFTQLFLRCLQKHHDFTYEGIIFGSSVNGMGLHDSDVDLRLRPIRRLKNGDFEPMNVDPKMVDDILKDIAFQTTRCSPSIGYFVPSSRCPVAKLTFVLNQDPRAIIEGLKYDISISASNVLGSFNSRVLRFLCYLEPKFHLLAIVLRYWTNVHSLVVPGLLSSYAVINMLIFFCQTLQPPLLPTFDQMRNQYLKQNPSDKSKDSKKALLQQEWNCLICLRKKSYKPSSNTLPLGVLLLKFFEFYLNFPYSTHIITTRPGKALSLEEFKLGLQCHPGFPIKSYLNIQDPFDFKHNLTSGMDGGHFRRLMLTIRISYERLFSQLMNNFESPFFRSDSSEDDYSSTSPSSDIRKLDIKNVSVDRRNWGINSLFVQLTDKELRDE